MRIFRFLPGLILLLMSEARAQSWSLELPLGFPEGLGAGVHYEASPLFSLSLSSFLPTPLQVKTEIKSRKLVDREGIVIRSPRIDLPFHVNLGPHHVMGFSYRPFAAALFFNLAWETRLLTITSEAQSHLEILDAENRMQTNTLFQARARTETRQTLLRPSFGYRWDLGTSSYFLSLYSGWSRPLTAESRVQSEVRVRNPEASRPSEVDARNLQDAETEQSRVMEQGVRQELQKFERMTLPVFGISVGKFL